MKRSNGFIWIVGLLWSCLGSGLMAQQVSPMPPPDDPAVEAAHAAAKQSPTKGQSSSPSELAAGAVNGAHAPQEMKGLSKAESPKLEPGMQVSVTVAEFEACSAEQKAYMKQHPESYKIGNVAPATLPEKVQRTEERPTQLAVNSGDQKVIVDRSEMANLPQDKVAYIKAHPEAYTIVESKPSAQAVNVQPAAVQPASAVVKSGDQKVILDRSEIANIPQEKLAYITAHPESYIIVESAPENRQVDAGNHVTSPLPNGQQNSSVHGGGKIVISQATFDVQPPSKKEFILAHPEAYEITKDQPNHQ